MSPCAGLSPQARRLIERVRAADGRSGDPFAFMISGGCCGGTGPTLCRQSNIVAGFDVCLGEVDGVSIYAHPDHAQYLLRDHFVIDATFGARSDTFSLEIAHGGRFVLRELPGAEPSHPRRQSRSPTS